MQSTFKNSVSASVGLTPTVVYTAGLGVSTTVIGLSLANITTNLVYATVSIDKGGTVVNAIKDAPIPSGSSLVIFGSDQKLVLMAGNSISVTSSVATSVDAILSYMELA